VAAALSVVRHIRTIFGFIGLVVLALAASGFLLAAAFETDPSLAVLRHARHAERETPSSTSGETAVYVERLTRGGEEFRRLA
jgi:hypothetical protein